MEAKPSILLIHNRYLHKGGEDTVVAQELSYLESSGYRVIPLYFHNQAAGPIALLNYPFQLFFNLSAFYKVYRLVKKHKIEIVHVHNFFYRASPAVFWAAKAAGAYTLLTLHNYRLFCLNGFMYYNNQPCTRCYDEKSFRAGIQRKCFKNSGLFSRVLAASYGLNKKLETFSKKIDRYVVINPLQEQFLLNSGIPKEKIFKKSNFLLKSLDTSSPAPFSTRENFYLYVGRLSEEKGIRDLVEAFMDNGKPLKIVGDGPLAEWVQEQIRESEQKKGEGEHTIVQENSKNQAKSNIEYLAAVPRESLAALYASCAALILPSRWFEVQPMTVIEAQSHGSIVIAADSANMRGMISHEADGYLYPIHPINQLNEVISIFEARSNETKDALSKAAYDRFQRSYTINQHINALKLLYHFESRAKNNSGETKQADSQN
ncbi:glycosyltransferase family 4 protein [Sediminibacterium sp. TEGAF015]|uniref:glycosyltransferase family 4 protein n=1 Tax=Sediminibacterium sp. TEGAF015 TaxID=575378 RepID=UPI0022015156|nr:glycosyltransferase family 4 protein [Sediminibacterium sp. TEGAF015]BDQ13369.1 glycosyl transferase family 1 [Sediminibacterium sp. TEGAF015]